jgi:hypothetical protein
MWIKGKAIPIWDDSFKNFNFVKQPLTEEELHAWRSQGYTHESFTGTMYDSRNPMPEWCKLLSDHIGLKNCGYVIYRMKTGDIMPTHVDHFRRYCEVFQVEKKNVYRAIVFLEDWKPGHYFEIEGTAVCDYKKGDYVLWSNEVPHAAANIGIEDRYTLQITGVMC